MPGDVEGQRSRRSVLLTANFPVLAALFALLALVLLGMHRAHWVSIALLVLTICMAVLSRWFGPTAAEALSSNQRYEKLLLPAVLLLWISLGIVAYVSAAGTRHNRPPLWVLILAAAAAFFVAITVAVFTVWLSREGHRARLEQPCVPLEATVKLVTSVFADNLVSISLWSFGLLALSLVCSFVIVAFTLFSGTGKEGLDATGFALTLLLTCVGVGVGAVAMHHAFQAHQDAFAAKDRAETLYQDRVHYLEGFDGFLRRIHALVRVQPDDPTEDDRTVSQRSDVWRAFDLDDLCVDLDCIFLTPFLGHAGISATETPTPETEELVRLFEHVRKELLFVARQEGATVRIVTLKPNAMMSWYAQILAVNASRKMTKRSPDETLDQWWQQTQIDIAAELPGRLWGAGIEVGRHTIFSFNKYMQEYANGAEEGANLEIRQSDTLPFQLFLVHPHKKADLHLRMLGDCHALVTYVGSDTYAALLRRLIQPGDAAGPPRDVNYLLDKLHACHHSQDPRVCQMLLEHFNNLWEACGKANWDDCVVKSNQVDPDFA